MIAVLEEFQRKGVSRLSISGGEPFCRSDIYDILQKASDLGFDIYLSTNGTNDIFVEKLRSYSIKVLQVSIDGLEQTHDAIRGKAGAFLHSIKFLEEAHKKMSASIGVAFSLMPQNADDAVSLFRFLHDHSLSDIFSVIPVQKLGRAEEGNMLSAKDLKNVLSKLASYYLQGDRKVELNVMAPPAIVPLEIKNTTYGNGYLCEFPYSVAVNADGTCSICDGLLNLSDVVSKNIRKDNDAINQLFQTEVAQKWLHTSPSQLEGICRRCSFLELCCGGCRVDSFLHTGSFYSSDPLCQRYYDAGIFPEEYIRN